MTIASAPRKRQRFAIQPQLLPTPPRARLPPGLGARKMVIVEDGPHVTRRRVGEWVLLQECQHGRRPFQQATHQSAEPRVMFVSTQRREPHLPVQSRLMWLD